MLCLFRSFTCFEQSCAPPQEGNCINTTSGIITVSWCLAGMQVEKELQFRHQLRATIPDVVIRACSCLTELYFMVEVYLHLLPKVQLNVSVFDNSHLQVVHESLESSYTRLNMGCVQWGCGRCGGHEISYVSWRLGVGYMG